MPNMHSTTIVQGQYCPIMFFITNIFFGRGLYPSPTAIATGSNCRASWGLHIDSDIASSCRNKRFRGILILFSASRWTDLMKLP